MLGRKDETERGRKGVRERQQGRWERRLEEREERKLMVRERDCGRNERESSCTEIAEERNCQTRKGVEKGERDDCK